MKGATGPDGLQGERGQKGLQVLSYTTLLYFYNLYIYLYSFYREKLEQRVNADPLNV